MKEDVTKFVGKKVKEYRKTRKMTQKELGLKIGVKHNTVSSYENGTNEPDLQSIFAIAKVLDVDINDLFPSPILDVPEVATPNLPVNAEPVDVDLVEKYINLQNRREFQYPYYPLKKKEDHINFNSFKKSEYLEMPDKLMGKWAGSRDIFITNMIDEDMNRIIPQGSLVAVKRTDKFYDLKDGDIAIYKYKEKISIRRFYRVDDFTIYFSSASHNPYTFDQEISINQDGKEFDLMLFGKIVVYVVELD